MNRAFCVLGGGGWGTAMAIVLAGLGHDVRLWVHDAASASAMIRRRRNPRFLPGIAIPREIRVTTDAAEALRGTDRVFTAVPTRWLRSVLRTHRGAVPAGLPVVSLSKGIEERTLARPSQIIRAELGRRPVVILSGPSHAEEVARGLPATVVAASTEPRQADAVQEEASTAAFRIYTNRDPLGVELCGAMKNVIAIAAGICDGLHLGDNAKAALVTRGVAEMARLGVALGARRATFFGLAGIGDLFTTCVSKFGRNRAVGERIGRGESLAAIVGGTRQVAEGVFTTRSLHRLARSRGVGMPITAEIHAVLFRGKDPASAVVDLMRRAAGSESGR